MLRFLRRRATSAPVSFCDSCGHVCTSACRADAYRDRARTDALRHGLPR